MLMLSSRDLRFPSNSRIVWFVSYHLLHSKCHPRVSINFTHGDCKWSLITISCWWVISTTSILTCEIFMWSTRQSKVHCFQSIILITTHQSYGLTIACYSSLSRSVELPVGSHKALLAVYHTWPFSLYIFCVIHAVKLFKEFSKPSFQFTQQISHCNSLHKRL